MLYQRYVGNAQASGFLRGSAWTWLFLILAWLGSAGQGRAAIYAWNGGGASAYWSDPNNWSFMLTPPTNGDTLIFPGFQPRATNTNDIANLTLNQIRILGSNYVIYGSPFTLTNSLVMTNTTLSGTSIISVSNLNLGASDLSIQVSSAATLNLNTIVSNTLILGSAGVVKSGAGSLLYSGTSNAYSGTTTVNAGALLLGCGADNEAFAGPLVIGDGINSATVRLVLDRELPVTQPITINTNATLDLNNLDDIMGASLTLNGNGSVLNAAPLTLAPNATVTANLSTFLVGNASISGALNVNSSTCTFVVNPAPSSTASLLVPATVSGSATITKTGAGFMSLSASNSFTGPMIIANGTLSIGNPFALGTTSAGTSVSNSATLWLAGVSVTNEPLTIASTGIGIENASGANTWVGPITLAAQTTMQIDGASLNLQGVLSGSGGFTKTSPGTLRLTSGGNSYAGNTTVNQGVLELNGLNVIRFGTLTIGDGLGGANADVVRYVSAGGIYGGPGGNTVVITPSGLLDLNGFTDDVGPIYMDGGTISTGAGTLYLFTPLATIQDTVGTNLCTINGNLSLSTSQTNTFAVSNTLVINAVISDTSSNPLVKTGPGLLYLNGANTYTGPTLLQQGWIWAQNNLALGAPNSGTVVSNGATLVLAGNINIANETLTLNGPGEPGWMALDCENPETNIWAGPIVLAADSNIGNHSSAGLLRLTGPISGPGGLNEGYSTGTLNLEGPVDNTYGGLTTVNAGTTLQLAKTGFDGAVPNDLVINGTVRNLVQNQINNLSTVTIGPSGFLDLGGVLSTNTILPSPVNTFSSSGTWTLGYAFTPNANLTVTHVRSYFGTKVEIWTDTGTLLASQSVSSVPGTWVETALSSPIQLTAGAHYRLAAYTAGANYYWRSDLPGTFPNGTIDQSYETSSDAFPTNTDTARWWFVDLRYTVLGPNGGDGIGSLNGSGTVNIGANFINSFGTGTGAHTYNGVLYGSGFFYVDASAFSYTLNGNNTSFTGQTFLYDGTTSTVKINGSQPQSSVYVGNLATLGGSGTVGNITADGMVSPGNSPGILTSSNVTFVASGGFSVELTGPTAGTDYDQLNVRGTVALGNASLTVLPAFTTPVAIGQQFVIINNDGVDAISGTFNGLAEGATITTNNYQFTISYVGGTGNDVALTLTAIPGAVAASSVTSGNGNGTIDPNECGYLSVVISNKTGTPMTGISATLSSATPNVAVTQPFSAYPDVPGSGTGTNAAAFQISATTNFTCGTNISLQLSVNSSLGSFTMNLVLPTGQPSAVPNRYDNSTSTSIPDVGSINSTNTVSGFVGPLTKVVVAMYVTHTFDSDLTNISLIAPDGTTVLLSSANGGGGQNYGTNCSPDASRTTFDDAAGTSITNGAAPFVGTFRPQSPLSALIGNGTPNGNWRLHIADGFGGSLGTLRCWSLFLFPTVCAPGGGLCALCPNVTITGATGPASPAQTNYLSFSGIPSTCGVPKVCPGTTSGSTFPSDNYTFVNGPSDACVTVTVEDDSPTVAMLATVYSGSYNPANPDKCINYLADGGKVISSANPVQAFSFNVASNATFVVNLIANAFSPTAPYKLTVSGGDCRPVLNIAPVGTNNVQLDWTTAAPGFNLERSNSLVGNPSIWQPVTNIPIVVNSRFRVTNNAAIGNQFFRLHKP
jgi:autotransporter-associated beta strand protein